MKKILFRISAFWLVWGTLFIAACGTSSGGLLGGSEIGNPPNTTVRALTGVVEPQDATTTLIKQTTKYLTVNCRADTVVATPLTGDAVSVEIEDDCSFIIELTVSNTYALDFYLSGTLVAGMIFDNNNDLLEDSLFALSAGEAAIDLGQITFEGSVAFPEFEPATQNDQDGDGIVDYDDTSDVNSDVSTATETSTATDTETQTATETVTDNDTDDDGVLNDDDNCPNLSNTDQFDYDQDGHGNVCDNCAFSPNPDQSDQDADGIGDSCDV